MPCVHSKRPYIHSLDMLERAVHIEELQKLLLEKAQYLLQKALYTLRRAVCVYPQQPCRCALFAKKAHRSKQLPPPGESPGWYVLVRRSWRKRVPPWKNTNPSGCFFHWGSSSSCLFKLKHAKKKTLPGVGVSFDQTRVNQYVPQEAQ